MSPTSTATIRDGSRPRFICLTPCGSSMDRHRSPQHESRVAGLSNDICIHLTIRSSTVQPHVFPSESSPFRARPWNARMKRILLASSCVYHLPRYADGRAIERLDIPLDPHSQGAGCPVEHPANALVGDNSRAIRPAIDAQLGGWLDCQGKNVDDGIDYLLKRLGLAGRQIECPVG